jgi:K+-transporting ATPase ATPase C chain
MRSQLRAGITLFALLTLLTGVVYPLLVTLLAQGVFPHKANGSLVEKWGKIVGSDLLGQHFDHVKYFWGRPSATDSVPYNAESSTGSNLGPTNSKLLDAVRDKVEALRKAHPDQVGPVPADLVTTSASGLDPHISPAAAEYQVTRVARARGWSEKRVRDLIAEHTDGRTLGILGESRVHVLRLNLALDNLDGRP